MATFRHVEVIEAWIWGQRVGAVAWDPNRRTHVFEYDPDWWRSGVQLAPIMMPVDPGNPAPASRRPAQASAVSSQRGWVQHVFAQSPGV